MVLWCTRVAAARPANRRPPHIRPSPIYDDRTQTTKTLSWAISTVFTCKRVFGGPEEQAPAIFSQQ